MICRPNDHRHWYDFKWTLNSFLEKHLSLGKRDNAEKYKEPLLLLKNIKKRIYICKKTTFWRFNFAFIAIGHGDRIHCNRKLSLKDKWNEFNTNEMKWIQTNYYYWKILESNLIIIERSWKNFQNYIWKLATAVSSSNCIQNKLNFDFKNDTVS